jgi:hypothetical protein
MLQATTLRPGLLVSLKTALRGNLSYDRVDLTAYTDDAGAQHAKWETERTIQAPAEHDAAVATRGQCRRFVTAICSNSSFGLLCPEARIEELDAAIGEARELAAKFNSEATQSRIGIYVIVGRVAADDVEAVRAINSEIRDLLSAMENGLRNLDVEGVRKAAGKARALGQMLTPEADQRMKKAIDVARRAAREIVKAGEQGAVEIDQAAIRAMVSARTAFLDVPAEDVVVAEPDIVGRAIDLDPTEPEPIPAFEMEDTNAL